MADYVLSDAFSGKLTKTETGTRREFDFHAIIEPFATYLEAEAHAAELCPENIGAHERASLTITPIGNNYWDVKAHYQNPDVKADDKGEDPKSGDSNNEGTVASVSWDTTGGTEHATQAYYDQQIGGAAWGGEYAYSRQGPAPKFYGAINCSSDAVQGVDIVVPSFNWSETWTWPAALVNDNYVKALYELTGSTNKEDFRVFSAGEVLFMGARADRQRSAPTVAITYTFSARRNRENFLVGEVLVDQKLGWQYLWVKYEDKSDTDNLVKRPLYVYVNDIYPTESFDALGLGRVTPILAPTNIQTFAGL